MKAWGPLVVVVALAIGLAPGTAFAKPGHEVLPAQHEAAFRLKGTNGFRVEFSDTNGRASVSAKKGSTSVLYFVKHAQRSSDGRFVGKLPGLGGFAVRFKPTGKVEELADGCPGAPERRHGTFVGTMRFRGERGYTQVRAGSAPGTLTESARRVCPRHGEPSQGGGSSASFLSFYAGRGDLALFAGTSVGESQLSFSFLEALATRTRNGVQSLHTATNIGNQPELLLSGDPSAPEAATLSPRPPFTGSAEYHLTSPTTSTWTGDLAVELPGLGRVHLAGAGFYAGTCVAEKCSGSLPANIIAVAGASASLRVQAVLRR